jgi:hypothetical protein
MNAVITYIFGKGQEILRDPLVIDPDVDYICVTDQKHIRSNKWRIIYDKIPEAKCTRDKMPLVKYNPFSYTIADKVIVLDGTLQITGTLNHLFEMLDEVPLLIKKHPTRTTLSDELNAWIKLRGVDPYIIPTFHAMASVDNISLDRKFLVESCILGFNNSPEIITLCCYVLAYMLFLGHNGKMCMTNQCPLTYLIEKMNIPYSFIDQATVATRYRHNSWIKVNR